MKHLIFLLLLSAQAVGQKYWTLSSGEQVPIGDLYKHGDTIPNQKKDSVCTGGIFMYLTNPGTYSLDGYHLPGCKHVAQVNRLNKIERAGFEAEQEAMRRNDKDDSEAILRAMAAVVNRCPHKWVELHQDTLEVNLRLIGFSDPSIPLICLICHQEKKKIIHYKKEGQ